MTETSRRPRVYDSAVDLWVGVLLFLAPLLAAAVGIVLLIQGRPSDAAALFLTGAVILIATGALTMPCRYTLLDDALSIRCGILFYQIPLREILRVERSASLRSGPALSLRRVQLVTGRRSYLISPKDRDDFIRELDAAIQAGPCSDREQPLG